MRLGQDFRCHKQTSLDKSFKYRKLMKVIKHTYKVIQFESRQIYVL